MICVSYSFAARMAIVYLLLFHSCIYHYLFLCLLNRCVTQFCMCDSQPCRIRNLILGPGKGGVVVQGDNEIVGSLTWQTGDHGSLNPLRSVLSYVQSHIGRSTRRGNILHVISHVAWHSDKHRAHWIGAIPSRGWIFSRPVHPADSSVQVSNCTA